MTCEFVLSCEGRNAEYNAWMLSACLHIRVMTLTASAGYSPFAVSPESITASLRRRKVHDVKQIRSTTTHMNPTSRQALHWLRPYILLVWVVDLKSLIPTFASL